MPRPRKAGRASTLTSSLSPNDALKGKSCEGWRLEHYKKAFKCECPIAYWAVHSNRPKVGYLVCSGHSIFFASFGYTVYDLDQYFIDRVEQALEGRKT